jgi:hypothetical protein
MSPSPISGITSLHSVMTLKSLAMLEDGKPWSQSLGITGGLRYQGTLADMSPPATCAYMPSLVATLQLENCTHFLF